MEFSFVRILGFLLGVLLFALLLKRLRTHSAQRSDVWGIFIVGGGLVILSLFPALANVPSDLLSLGGIRGGRIIALLVLATGVIFFMSLSNRVAVDTVKEQFDRFIRIMLAEKFISENKNLGKETVLIIVPAFNEEKSLAALLPRIPRNIAGRQTSILVIDDGSTDGTAQVALDAGSFVVAHPFNRGGGAALRTGYAIAEKSGVDIVVTMDGDGQHNPAEIEILLRPIIDNEADFVIGSRMMGTYDDYSKLRILGVRVFNGLINLLMGTKITDCASGFRALRLSALGRVDLIQDQYHTSELIIDAAKKNLRIVEREIHISARVHGYSKKGRNIVYAFGFMRTILATWWR